MPARSQQDRITEIKNAICEDLGVDDQDLGALFWASGTMRLTSQGLEIFKERYSYQEIDLPPGGLTGAQISRLAARMHLPYFFNKRTLVLFESRAIFRIQLQGGIEEWLSK